MPAKSFNRDSTAIASNNRVNGKKPILRNSGLPVQKKSKGFGFTLIEVVSSIVVTALAFTALANFFFNQSGRSIEPIFQIRAAKLGEAIMDEIIARPYDENTPVGGVPACDATPVGCTSIANLGPDAGEFIAGPIPIRTLLDDVDDYNGYCNNAAPYDIVDALGNSEMGAGNQLEDFDRFKMSICVGYDDDYNGVLNDAGGVSSKLIIVNIYPPNAAGLLDVAIEFKAYRGNY